MTGWKGAAGRGSRCTKAMYRSCFRGSVWSTLAGLHARDDHRLGSHTISDFERVERSSPHFARVVLNSVETR